MAKREFKEETSEIQNIENQNEEKNKRQKKILNHNYKIVSIKPLTPNQYKAFLSYGQGKNILMYGVAGTGKSFLALYFALSDLFSGLISKVIIVRSAVSSRDQGFLPGTLSEKMALYETPYRDMVAELCNGRRDLYDTLKNKGYLEFISTSFIRGLTFNDSIIILDEIQNMTDHEIHSVLTRVGENAKVILCGDSKQDDLKLTGRKNHESGLGTMVLVARQMEEFDTIEFGLGDIVRSGFVRAYIIARTNLNL